jgi:hypothetical protein
MSFEFPKNQTPDERISFDRRRLGLDRNGCVFLREFDEGVVLTMKGELIDGNYYLKVPNVSPPPDRPGVPVTFAYPEDVYETHVLPTVVVRRDDISAAMRRWHPGMEAYRTEGDGALPVTVTIPGQAPITKFDRSEVKLQPEPVDIMYTISILARHRQGIGGRNEANRILRYILAFYNAYSSLKVIDDLGDKRTYECFREGISMLDDLPEVSGRMIGFAITLRVEGEFDIAPAQQFKKVTTVPELGKDITVGQKT